MTPLLGTTPSKNSQIQHRNTPDDISDILGTRVYQGYVETLLQTLDGIIVNQPKWFLPLVEEAKCIAEEIRIEKINEQWAGMSESSTSSRTTMSAETTPSSRQLTSEIHRDTSCNGLSQCCMHVHQPLSQVCKLGESLALRKVKHPHNGKTSVSRFPLTKQEILSQYSGCFEGIGCFPGDLYKFHLKPDHKLARHAPRKVPVHLEAAFKEEIESLVKQGILEEVKEHTDWVNSYVIVEKDTGNQHAPNHTVKKKLRICLDPRDLKEALEREPYHTRSVD